MKLQKINPRSRLVSATRLLSTLGIEVTVDSVAQRTTLAQIQELEVFGREETQVLTEVVEKINSFNDVAASQIKGMRVGDRHETIRQNFETILEDSERMVRQISENGKVGLVAKIQNRFVKWRRGSVEARFSELRNTAEQVFADAEEQLKREYTVLEAYSDFGVALKEATLVAREIHNRAKDRYSEYADKLGQAQKEVDEGQKQGLNDLQVGALELARDQAQREYDVENRRLEIAATLAEQLQLSHGISEGVMARYSETTKTKEKVQRQSAMFYTANNGVLSTLTLAFKQLQGLHEQTETIKAMKEGTEKSIQRLASLGTQVQTEALKQAHTATVSPETIRNLYQKTIEFKKTQHELEASFRKTSEENYEATRQVIKDGQRRLAEVISSSSASRRNSSTDADASILEISIPEVNAEAISESRTKTTRATKKTMKASA